VASLLDALLGAGDADVGAGGVGAWNVDLGGGPQLQLLQLFPVLADDKAMVLLGDGDRSRGLGGARRRFSQTRIGKTLAGGGVRRILKKTELLMQQLRFRHLQNTRIYFF